MSGRVRVNIDQCQGKTCAERGLRKAERSAQLSGSKQSEAGLLRGGCSPVWLPAWWVDRARCNEAPGPHALLLCFPRSVKHRLTRTNPTHLPLPDPRAAPASLRNRFCSFPRRLRAPAVSRSALFFFSHPLCVLLCPASLVFSLWGKDNCGNVQDEVVINKGHAFFSLF